MINTDEDMLMCDLAETYHIFDYKSLPARLVATLSVGLRDNSRIKMKMNDMKHPLKTILLAGIMDKLSQLVWMQTKDGINGINQPKSILSCLLNQDDEQGKDIKGFNTPEEFETEWKSIVEGGIGNE